MPVLPFNCNLKMHSPIFEPPLDIRAHVQRAEMPATGVYSLSCSDAIIDRFIPTHP